MNETRAKEIVGARLAMSIIRFHCDAKTIPALKHNTTSAVTATWDAVEMLGLTSYVAASINRICGLDCRHCKTPIR